MKYTPAGVPAREATFAVPQKTPGKDSVGYHDLLFFGDVAEQEADRIRIGSSLKVSGSLWSRSYRNRKGAKVNETKILVESIEWTS